MMPTFTCCILLHAFINAPRFSHVELRFAMKFESSDGVQHKNSECALSEMKEKRRNLEVGLRVFCLFWWEFAEGHVDVDAFAVPVHLGSLVDTDAEYTE